MQRLRSCVYGIFHTSGLMAYLPLWFIELLPNLGQTNETIASGSVNNKETYALSRKKYAHKGLLNLCTVSNCLYTRSNYIENVKVNIIQYD